MKAENEARGQTEDGSREQGAKRPGFASDDPWPGEEERRLARAATSPSTGAHDPTAKRDVTSWINWQSALYLFVLGWLCLVLVPLTSFWWIALACGTAVPVALATLDRPSLTSKRPDDRKAKERPDDRKAKEQELLHLLAERDELTPATAAMWTSLIVDEASKMLEELARKGHLKVWVEDGVMAYALPERDRHEKPGETCAPFSEAKGDGALRRLESSERLEEPLTERELEVLSLLASGRTNSEVARDLFVSVGTVKSHTGNIYRKLDARNRTQALARAREFKVL